jgi:hypothetical protein
MTKDELKSELLKHGMPQMMLTRNTRSFFGYKISSVTKGFYNHFCWLFDHDVVASQNFTFHKTPLDDYLTDNYFVKFVTDTRWGEGSRKLIQTAIEEDLNEPVWKRLYDPVAILGQYTGFKWLQLPILDICSDYGRYLGINDPKYNLKYPSPSDINRYQKANQSTEANHYLGYKVTARWEPDDF